ncbi:hypothetical protein AVEN_119950-1 [Araneus ventricosus]|uniref:Uncharacterized protein n=1 Tax=Araneus ventricosus TaxID=182803 RepID=A0A4Y2QE44_ARAVE|nr:hypothetical protein AVEN_119950-1 [Araneus ventricosus]
MMVMTLSSLRWLSTILWPTKKKKPFGNKRKGREKRFGRRWNKDKADRFHRQSPGRRGSEARTSDQTDGPEILCLDYTFFDPFAASCGPIRRRDGLPTKSISVR